jgi:hypothetical protein
MKNILFLIFILFSAGSIAAQTYPEPEFSNEVYYLKKDSVNTLMRLEKGSSKMESKTKMGGFGGYESGYEMEGGKSTVRLSNGTGLSFIFSSSTSSGSSSSVAKRDSMMRANGLDPSMIKGMGGDMSDPSNRIALYKAEPGKDKRKILLQKSPGASPFGSHKTQSSDKYTFSVRKIREGYWELVIDKPLSKGEYVFTVMNTGMGAMDGATLLFGFAID